MSMEQLWERLIQNVGQTCSEFHFFYLLYLLILNYIQNVDSKCQKCLLLNYLNIREGINFSKIVIKSRLIEQGIL